MIVLDLEVLNRLDHCNWNYTDQRRKDGIILRADRAISHPLVLYASHLVCGVRPVKWLKSGTGSPEGLWSSHPRRHWGAIWTQFCAVGSGWSWGLDLQKSLPASISEIQKNVSRVMGLCFHGENSSAFPSYHSPTNTPLKPQSCHLLWLKDFPDRALQAFIVEKLLWRSTFVAAGWKTLWAEWHFPAPSLIWKWGKAATALMESTAQSGENWLPPMLLCCLLVYKL